MGVLTRRLIKQDLDKVDVFIEDTNNEYFVVQDIPDTFTQGRTTFKIFGSNFLKDNIPLKIEILDKLGNTVYVQPVKYGQPKVGGFNPNPSQLNLPFRYVSVEVYRPPINISGEATLVILAELDSDTVPFEIPKEYIGRYNVKYKTKINIDSTEPINKSPILFYRRPKFTVQEIVKAQLINQEIITSTITGSFDSSKAGGGVIGLATNAGDDYQLPSDTNASDNTITATQTDTSDTFDDKEESDETFNKPEEKLIYNLPKYQTGEQKRPSFLSKFGFLENKSSPEPPEFKIVQYYLYNPTNKPQGDFKSKMAGGEIRIAKEDIYVTGVRNLFGRDYRSTSLDQGFLSDFASEYVSWNDYTGSIERVENSNVLHLREPFYVVYQPPAVTAKKLVKKANFGSPYVTNGTSPFTSSFQDLAAPSTSSYRFDSFIDLDLTDLRTFSGDVFRLRVSGKSQSQQGDFPVLLDTIVESPELLVDSNSPSGVLRTGFFQSQAHTNFYWESGSNTSVTYDNRYLIDGIRISGSYENYLDVGRFQVKDDFNFKILKGTPYTLTFRAYGKKTNKNDLDGNVKKQGKLFFHLSSSLLRNDNDLNINNSSLFGQTLTDENNRKVGVDLRDIEGETFTDLGIINHTFVPKFKSSTSNKATDVKLQLRVNSGEWYISDISLRPATDTGFSPDTFSARIPIPNNTQRPDRFDFLIEYFNIDNDAAKSRTFIRDVPIIGAPLILEGGDNMLTGSLFLGSLQGSGIEMKGGSAFIRAVGYQGFASASEGKGGGFLMWSGSVKPGGETQDNYTGAGLEIHDGNIGVNESFFKFRTSDPDNNYSSSFDIKTSRFFLGQENNNFVSGALGNIEISSSNFHLQNDRDLVMQGTITATAGKIGDFDIIDGQISGSNITLNAPKSQIFKTDQGPGSDTSATFDQLRDEYYIDFTPSGSNDPAGTNYYVKFGPKFMVDKDGLLIASGATFEGSITASAGLIGGFTTDDDSFFSGVKSSPSFFISGSATGLGQSKTNLVISSSGFSVNSQGEISASSGVIGGWQVNTTNLVDSNNKLKLEPNGTFIISSSDFQVDNNGRVSASAGNIAGWNINQDQFTGGKMEIKKEGTIQSVGFQRDTAGSGFRLTADQGGFLEVENAKIRGTLSTAVFEKETVNAVGGQLYVANSTVLTGSVSNPNGIHTNTTTTMSVENVSGFTQGEILSIKKVSSTGFSTEYVLVNSSSRFNAGSETDLSGDLFVQRGYGAGTTGDSGSLGGSPVTAQSYSGSQVVVSTGKLNTGFIRLNANPNDLTTPYIDIVERTGSGLYDIQLKARLGDLSGLTSDKLHGTNPNSAGFGLFSENVFLQGGIVANTGSIAGVRMEDNQLFIGAGDYVSSSTPFYVSGKPDATAGDFSLGDKLKFDASTGRLTISGEINITEGPLAGVTTQSLAETTGSTDLPDGLVSSSIQLASAISGSTSALSSSITDTIMTDATGKLVKLPSTSGSTGLVQNARRMGFINGGTFTSFISSSGAFIFQGADSNNLISFDGVSGNLIIKSNETVLSGSSVNILTEKFFLGGNSQFISGSSGNIEVSSSRFHLQSDGDVVMNDITASNANVSGKITAQTGTIGGFNIGSDLDSTSGTLKLKGASGQLTASAAQITGNITANTGTIGGFTIGSDLDSSGGNLKIAGSSGTIRSGTATGQRVTLASNILSFHNSSNVQVLDLTGSITPTINIAGAGIGGSGDTTFTANGGINFSSAGGIFINGTANGSFADVFIGPNNIIHQSNNQTEKYTYSFGNYLQTGFGGGKSSYGMSLFAVQNNPSGDIDVEALNVLAQTGDSLSDDSRIRGMTLKLNDGLGYDSVGSGNAVGLKVAMNARDTGSNYGIYVDFKSRSSLFDSPDVVGSGFGVYSTAKIASEKDIIAFVSSDERLKTNIKPVDDSLNKIIKLNGVSFEWKDGYDDRVQNKTNLGVIAQDVQEVIPEIVKERKDGYLAVQYDQLVPVLIEAVKDQQKQIDELKKKLEVD